MKSLSTDLPLTASMRSHIARCRLVLAAFNRLFSTNRLTVGAALLCIFACGTATAQTTESVFSNLGHGWDVFEASDSPQAKKPRIVDVFVNLCSEPSESERGSELLMETARNISSLTKKLTVQTKVSGEYGAFKGEVESHYSKTSTSSSDRYTALIANTFTRRIYSCSEEQIRRRLSKKFIEDINNPRMLPHELIDTYGTHVISKVKYGGRLFMHLTSTSTLATSSEEFELAAKATYGKVSAEAKTKFSQATADQVNKMKVETTVLGGSLQSGVQGARAPDDYVVTAWESSLDQKPSYIGRPAQSLIPIWHFAEDEQRKRDIKFNFEVRQAKHAIENPLEFSKTVKAEGGTVATDLNVPPGYKILSGGAQSTWEGYGRLLVRSYPQNTTTWSAASKDHIEGDAGMLTVSAVAIYDPGDHWNVEIKPRFYEKSATGWVRVPTNYTPRGKHLTGGGAKIDFTGDGALLTSLVPTDEGTGYYLATSKANSSRDSHRLTTYAVWLSPKSEAAKRVIIKTKVFSADGAKQSNPQKDAFVDGGYVLVGGGAEAVPHNVGQLLTASIPKGNLWYGESKDHMESRHAPIKVYAIGLDACAFIEDSAGHKLKGVCSPCSVLEAEFRALSCVERKEAYDGVPWADFLGGKFSANSCEQAPFRALRQEC